LKSIGHDVRAIEFDGKQNEYRSYENVDSFRIIENLLSVSGITRMMRLFIIIFRIVARADVIHVFSDFKVSRSERINQYLFNLIFLYIHPQRNFVTFLGSEVRNPELELNLNKFYKYAYFDKSYEYANSEKKSNSYKIQNKYSKCGFHLICSIETKRYIDVRLFKSFVLNHHPSSVGINFSRNSKCRGKLKFLHAPTAPVAKGTKFVLEAIRELERNNILGYEFEIVSNLSNLDFLTKLSEADVYLDQLIWGWYGIAAQQAMELGVVVIAHLTHDRLNSVYESPIVNADINSLYDVILNLISLNPEQIDNLKKETRKYYLDYHHPERVVIKSLEHYLE
jgi:hypothetical protein